MPHLGTRTRAAAILLSAAAIATVAAPTSLGAGYGHGRFVGTAKPQFGGGPGSPVIIKVKGSRVRVVEITFNFDCASDGSVLKRTVSTPFARVRSGPAGGGATFNGKVTPKEGGPAIDLSVAYGLRQTKVLGTSDATMDVEGLPCMKDLAFKANKR